MSSYASGMGRCNCRRWGDVIVAQHAAGAIVADERALLAIAGVHRALDVVGDVAWIGVGVGGLGGAGAGGGAELLPLERREQGIERTVEDLGKIARGDAVAEESLGPQQLVLGVLIDGELQGEAQRGERGELGGGRRRGGRWIRIHLRGCRSRRRRQGLELGRKVRARGAVGQEQVDVGLAHVGGGGEEFVGVLDGEVRGEEDDGGEVEAAVGDGEEDLGKAAGGARGADALEGDVLGEVQAAHAVGVHGGTGGGEIEGAGVDLGEVGEQRRGGATIGGDEVGEAGEEGLIGEVRERIGAHDDHP